MSPTAAETYFATFYPQKQYRPESFADFYTQRFGRRRYAIPTIVLIAVGLTAATWVTTTALGWAQLRSPVAGALNEVSAAALTGGYLWVVADLIARWRFRDLSQSICGGRHGV